MQGIPGAPRREVQDAFGAPQVADGIGGNLPRGIERPSVQALARDLCLLDAAVLPDMERLCTVLARELRAMGMAVIEDIGHPLDLDDAAVVVAEIEDSVLFPLMAAKPHIAVADDDTAEDRRLIGSARARPAEFMALRTRIDEVISAPDLPEA